MAFLITILVFIVGLFLIALPVKIAAAAMGAKRTGFLWCLLSLAGASILQGMGLLVPIIGNIVAFFLSAVAFAAILGTGFLRGIGIAILHIIFSVIIAVILVVVFGISVPALIAL